MKCAPTPLASRYPPNLGGTRSPAAVSAYVNLTLELTFVVVFLPSYFLRSVCPYKHGSSPLTFLLTFFQERLTFVLMFIP